jgi:hypothetical protein
MNLWHRSALRLLAPLTAVAAMVLGSAVTASASPASGAAVRSLEQAQGLTTGEYVYLIHKKTGRYLDAHEIGGTYDFNVVTRPLQGDFTQVWYRTPVFVTEYGDTVYEIMQISSGRFLDAHEIPQNDFRAVTRERQFNTTQYWWMSNTIIGGVETTFINQWSSNRELQAYDTSSMDYRAVTRDCCNSSQIWQVVPAIF